MLPNTILSEIMTSDVITVDPEDTMDKIRDIFRTNNIHHVPVVKDGKVRGIISKSDYHLLLNTFTFFKREKSETYNTAIMRSLLVHEVMTKQVATLNENDTTMRAASIFRENLFHAIPIVDEEKNLVGIVTTYDLLNHAYKEATLIE